MARINVFMTIPDSEIRDFFDGDIAKLEASIKARLDEVYGDLGHVEPHVLGIEVENDPED